MEDYLRHWGGRLRVAWAWVLQPLLMGLLLATVLLIQPGLHVLQSVLTALADEQLYAQMAEAQGWRGQLDRSVRRLVGFVPVERLAGIGDEAPDEAEQAMLTQLEGCRDRVADTLSGEVTRISETVVAKVPLYITSPDRPELDFTLDMASVGPVFTDCGEDISRNALGFVTHRVARLATEQVAADLRDPANAERLRDPEQAAAVLAETADALDLQRQDWLNTADTASKAMEAGETAARWRGMMKTEDETDEPPPSLVWRRSLDKLNGVHQRYTDRMRALPPSDVAAAEDPAAYVLEQLSAGLADESAMLVETQAKPYLASLAAATSEESIELTELSLAVRGTLAPMRNSYRGFAYTGEVVQRAIWLLLVLMAILAWQVRKVTTWMLSLCLGCAMLTWLYSAAGGQALRQLMEWAYPEALGWTFSQRLFEVAGATAAMWSLRWLLAGAALLVLAAAIRALIALAARAVHGRASEAHFDHLTDPEHRLTLADPLLLPLAALEATVTRRGLRATPAEATRRRRIMATLAVDYLLAGLLMYLFVLALELFAGLVSQLLEEIPFLGDWIDPSVSGQVTGWATGVLLILVLALLWTLRDALVLYLPRVAGWLDTARWCGLHRHTATGARPGPRPWLARVAVITAIVLLTLVIPLSGGVLVALLIAWILEAAILVLRARDASLADRLGGLHITLATPPDDGL